MHKMLTHWLILIGSFSLLIACRFVKSEVLISPEAPVKLVYYDWEDDIPIDVLDDFTERTGIQVEYQPYLSDTIAEHNLVNGIGIYDVMIADNDTVSLLIKNGLLHELSYENIPNFRYISINFRDLVYDPGNRYSIPFNWGSTGLISRNQQEELRIKTWADLWRLSDEIKIGIRKDIPLDNFAIAKRKLGYSINECDPAVITTAYQALLELTPNLVPLNADTESAIDALESGEIDFLVGWSDDVFEARSRDMDVIYFLPEDGTFLWGDSYIIPMNSSHKAEAEQLINFFLEPKIAARILAYNNYASANDRAYAYLPAELVFDKIIFPPAESLKYAEIFMPISEECHALQLDLWKQLIDQLP